MFGMFGSKKASNETNSYVSNVSHEEMYNKIGKGTVAEGTINSEGEIRLEGVIKGLLVCQSKVVIGPTGEAHGDVDCQVADISGKIVGTLKVKDILFLRSTAVIEGDVFTHKMVMEEGAVLDGNCSMKSFSSGSVSFDNNSKVEAKAS